MRYFGGFSISGGKDSYPRLAQECQILSSSLSAAFPIAIGIGLKI